MIENALYRRGFDWRDTSETLYTYNKSDIVGLRTFSWNHIRHTQILVAWNFTTFRTFPTPKELSQEFPNFRTFSLQLENNNLLKSSPDSFQYQICVIGWKLLELHFKILLFSNCRELVLKSISIHAHRILECDIYNSKVESECIIKFLKCNGWQYRKHSAYRRHWIS